MALRYAKSTIFSWVNLNTVVPSKGDSDALLFCLRLLSKTLTFTLHLS